MRDLKHIILYQGENDDILRRPPSFLVKAGTLLICLTLTGIFIVSNYIMIPDMVHTELVIPKKQIDFLTASHDTIAAPFKGYLLESTYNKTPFFVNEGDTLFKMIPERDRCIQASFKTQSKYKMPLQLHIKQKIIIEGKEKVFPFHTFKINNLKKDTIEVYINIDPALVAYFYPASNGDYVLPAQVPINEQSIFSKVVSCFKNIL